MNSEKQRIKRILEAIELAEEVGVYFNIGSEPHIAVSLKISDELFLKRLLKSKLYE